MTSPFSSWKNLRRTPYQSFVALLVVITTFFMVYSFTTIMYISEEVLHYFETRPQILVFFETKVTDAEATAAADLIKQLDYVDEVKITGKSDAFAAYQQANQDEPLLLSLLTPELFPASLSISANSPEALDKIRTEIDKLDGVDEVDYRQDVVAEFLRWTKLVRNISLGINGLFVVQFVLVILVVTAMKVVNRRRTINIMRLLGASFASVRWMFVREAMILGIVGSVIAFGLSYAVYAYAEPLIADFIGEAMKLPLRFDFFIYQVLCGSLASGVMAGLAAWLSANKLVKK